MKIGILHITDIHFTQSTNLGSRLDFLTRVMINDFHDVNKVYLLLSGDIAYSGKKEEYAKAKIFIDGIKKIFNSKYIDTSIQPILIPGNHDCDFSKGSDLRNTILKSVNYETIGKDSSFVNLSIDVQAGFWGFYGFYFNPIPTDKLFYTIEDTVDNHKVSFICINTAWMSKLKETAGSLFFPVKRYEKLVTQHPKSDVRIATWHHPISWFTPSTTENNKKEFQNFIESLAPLHFIGHEHEHEHLNTLNINRDFNTHILSGKLFNDDKKPTESGFQTCVIELNDLNTTNKQYSWRSGHYLMTNESEFSLKHEAKKLFTIKKEFEKEINDTKIPLLFNKKDVRLLDIFIYPDIEPVANKDVDRLESYIDSSRIIETEYAKCVIDGESQIGKSTLLSAIFLNLYKEGNFPILCKGEEFKEINLEKITKRYFQRQYANSHNEYDRFMQLDEKKRILLIDDFQDSVLNTQSAKILFEEASKKFGKVIVVIDSTHSFLPSMQAEFSDWKFFTIKPLGYKKRNDLIERYHFLKENPITYNEETFQEQIKFSFDNVQSILGNKLMPSYPIFILSILQALEFKPMQQHETSFGYCYQTLIHYALNSSGVTNELIDSYFNFLTELAYHYINSNNEYISRTEFDDFYNSYTNNFHFPTFENVYKSLISSKIIIEKDRIVKFGYKYILYFLSAKKISDMIHKIEGQNVIRKLFENLHIERNANILVFVTHHSKDISFIEESMINSMVLLDNIQPITLFKDDPFYTSIQGIATQIKNDVLEINKSAKEERKKYLEYKDESEREHEVAEKELDNEENKEEKKKAESIFVPFQQSYRSIEIIGQIIRNRKGSLTKSKLQEMTKEIYTTGFRTVSYVSEILNNSKKDITKTILNKVDKDQPTHEISERVNMLIQMLSLQACLAILNKLTFSIGNKEMRELYKNVANDIGSPIAKLATFGINSYYGTVSINDLKEIKDELEGNLVATTLLKSRVKAYVYNRNLDYSTKQQFASILKMSLGSNTFKPNEEKRFKRTK